MKRKYLCKAKIVYLLHEFGELLLKTWVEEGSIYKPLKKGESIEWNYDPSIRAEYQDSRFSRATFYESLKELKEEGVIERIKKNSVVYLRLKKDKDIKEYLGMLKSFEREEKLDKKTVSRIIQDYEFYKRSNPEKIKNTTQGFQELSDNLQKFQKIVPFLTEILKFLPKRNEIEQFQYPMKDKIERKTRKLEDSLNISRRLTDPYKFLAGIHLILIEAEIKGEYPSNNPTNNEFCEKVLRSYKDGNFMFSFLLD
jgi:hypothetical protein